MRNFILGCLVGLLLGTAGVSIAHHLDVDESPLLDLFLLDRLLIQPRQPLPPMPHPFPKVPLYNYQLPCP